MKLLRDKRNSIWTEIVEHLSLKQLGQCMGDDYRSWYSKAERVVQVSKSKRVAKLANDLRNECHRISKEFTWFQGLPLERTELVTTLIHAHIVATQEYDYESVEDIEDYLHELKYAPTREEIFSQGGAR